MTGDALRAVIFGRGGQLGETLLKQSHYFAEVFAPSVAEVDFLQPASISKAIERFRPNLIINAAAYTDVDGAEQQREKAMAINCGAVEVMAQAAAKLNTLLIHISTDYVFSGDQISPYTEQDPTGPINYYGVTKLAGEEAIQANTRSYLIFRTSWLYAAGFDNFVSKVLRWSRTQETLRMVTDQVGSPTWAGTMSNKILELVSTWPLENLGQKSGIYHLAGKGAATRLDFAQKILELDPERHHQQTKTLLPAWSEDFPSPAVRPKFSALNCDRFEKTFGLSIPNWETELADAFENS